MDFIERALTRPWCPICEWPMAETAEQGCVPGDCCYRPEDPVEQERIRKKRVALALSRPHLSTPEKSNG